MHVSHHMPTPELNTRPQTRKPATDEAEARAYTAVTTDPDGGQRRENKRQPGKDEPDPPLPQTSGLLRPKARPLTGNRPGPFMAVTSVTEFWTELVMAERPAAEPEPAKSRDAGPSLLDLFAKAVK